MAGLAAVGGGSAQAVHDEEFQLDPLPAGANTADDGASSQDFDWENFFNNSGSGGDIGQSISLPNASRPGFLASGGAADYALPDASTYATGSKDTLPIQGGWQCTKSNNVGDKVDIVNSYATAYRDPSDDHLILYFGVEKSSPLGDSNIAVWFLKDGTANCSAPSGRATNWTGEHKNGDILLVSAFTNGGAKANVNAYEWVGDDATGALNPTPIASGKLCDESSANDEACSVVNRVPITPPWNHPDKNGGALDEFEFFEGGVDVGVIGTDTCFATAVANTRSSQSLTATLFDYDRFSLPVCGKLEVQKYIDVDLSGTSSTGDVVSGSAVSGWAFSVSGPSPATTVVCSGTTGTDGKLTCSTGSLENLAPGTYTITETQKTGFFNTDAADNTPDPSINESTTTVAGTVTVGIGGATAKFGNTCYVDKTFQINNVPTGVGAISVDWSVVSGTHSGQTGTIALTGTSTRTGTVADKFNQTDAITWSWYLNSDTGTKILGGTADSLSGGAYPACADTNQDNFEVTSISGFKYKDVDDNGDFNTGDLNGAGFTFDLFAGTSPSATATPLQTAVSQANGTYTFATGVAPGTYTVRERQETGWIQTEPASNGDRTVTVVLNQTSATVGDFGNHPLSKLDVTLTSLAKNPGTTTDATQASSITCKPSGGSNLTDTDADGNDFSATNLHIRTYECTVVVIDP